MNVNKNFKSTSGKKSKKGKAPSMTEEEKSKLKADLEEQRQQRLKLIHRNSDPSSQVIISPNKDQFIFVEERNDPFIVMTSFSIEQGHAHPCLKVPINRIIHSQAMLKMLPGGIVLHSDGKWITIDIISKVIEFDSTTLDGFIQFQLSNKSDLTVSHIAAAYQTVNYDIVQYVQFDDEYTNLQPDTLNISSIMLDRGAIVNITDAVEKILLIPVKDTSTGFIGYIEKQDLKLFNIHKRLWPELRFKVVHEKQKIALYSNLFKYDLDPLDGEHYIKVHRNYGGSDIQLVATHKLLDVYKTSAINQSLKCE